MSFFNVFQNNKEFNYQFPSDVNLDIDKNVFDKILNEAKNLIFVFNSTNVGTDDVVNEGDSVTTTGINNRPNFFSALLTNLTTFSTEKIKKIADESAIIVSYDEYERYIQAVHSYIAANSEQYNNEKERILSTQGLTSLKELRKDIKTNMVFEMLVSLDVVNFISRGGNTEIDNYERGNLARQYLTSIREFVDGLENADNNLLKQKINESGIPFYIPRKLPKSNWTEVEYKKIIEADKINKSNNYNLPVPTFICDLLIYLFTKAKEGLDGISPNSIFSKNTIFLIHKFNKIKLRRDKEKCIKVSNMLSNMYRINNDNIDDNVLTSDDNFLTIFCGPLNTSTFRCRRLLDAKVKLHSNFDRKCTIKKKGGKKTRTLRKRKTRRMRNKVGGGPSKKNNLGMCDSDLCKNTLVIFITGLLVVSIGFIITTFTGIAITETYIWGISCIFEPFRVIGSESFKVLNLL